MLPEDGQLVLGPEILRSHMETCRIEGLLWNPEALKSVMFTASCMEEDMLLNAVFKTDLQLLQAGGAKDATRALAFLQRIESSPFQRARVLARFSHRLHLVIGTYFNSAQRVLVNTDLYTLTNQAVDKLLAVPSHITQMIASARAAREVHRLSRKRSGLRAQIEA